MMTTVISKTAPLAAVLVSIGTVLTVWNWVLRPAHAAAWSAALGLFGCMAVALFLALRREDRGESERRAAQSVRSAVIFGGLIMVLSLAGSLAVALGFGDRELSLRTSMVALGLFFVFTGNTLPKTLTPLSSMQCDPARAQAFQRFAGWTWVTVGLGFVASWLVLPVKIAQPVSLSILFGGMLVVIAQIVRLRRRTRGSAL
jgi:hypothetical protein